MHLSKRLFTSVPRRAAPRSRRLHGRGGGPIELDGVPIETNAGNQDAPTPERQTSLNCAGNSYGVHQNGANYQLLYKRGTGEVKIVSLDSDGTGVTTPRGNVVQGRTHFLRTPQQAAHDTTSSTRRRTEGRASRASTGTRTTRRQTSMASPLRTADLVLHRLQLDWTAARHVNARSTQEGDGHRSRSDQPQLRRGWAQYENIGGNAAGIATF